MALVNLLTGCQAFRYTEDDLNRERDRTVAWEHERTRFGPDFLPPPDFAPLKIGTGSIAVPEGVLGGGGRQANEPCKMNALTATSEIAPRHAATPAVRHQNRRTVDAGAKPHPVQ